MNDGFVLGWTYFSPSRITFAFLCFFSLAHWYELKSITWTVEQFHCLTMDYRPLKSGLPTGRLATILITAFISISATLILLRLSPPGGKVSSFVPVAVGPPVQQDQDGSTRTGGGVVVVPEVDVGGFGNGFDEEQAKANADGANVVIVTSTSVVLQTTTSTVLQQGLSTAAASVNTNCHPADGALDVLRDMEEKYSNLRDDKFTYVFFFRPKSRLAHFVTGKVPTILQDIHFASPVTNCARLESWTCSPKKSARFRAIELA